MFILFTAGIKDGSCLFKSRYLKGQDWAGRDERRHDIKIWAAEKAFNVREGGGAGVGGAALCRIKSWRSNSDIELLI